MMMQPYLANLFLLAVIQLLYLIFKAIIMRILVAISNDYFIIKIKLIIFDTQKHFTLIDNFISFDYGPVFLIKTIMMYPNHFIDKFIFN
jgi:hypothetical protein